MKIKRQVKDKKRKRYCIFIFFIFLYNLLRTYPIIEDFALKMQIFKKLYLYKI